MLCLYPPVSEGGASPPPSGAERRWRIRAPDQRARPPSGCAGRLCASEAHTSRRHAGREIPEMAAHSLGQALPRQHARRRSWSSPAACTAGTSGSVARARTGGGGRRVRGAGRRGEGATAQAAPGARHDRHVLLLQQLLHHLATRGCHRQQGLCVRLRRREGHAHAPEARGKPCVCAAKLCRQKAALVVVPCACTCAAAGRRRCCCALSAAYDHSKGRFGCQCEPRRVSL